MVARVDWKTVTLADLADINPQSLGAATPSGFEFQYIDLSAVSCGEIDWHSVKTWRFSDAPSRARRLVQMGDVLFGTVRPGLQSHGRIGQVSSGMPLVASTGFAVVRARADAADSGFLAHYCLSRQASDEARRMEVGSNYPAVNESDVRRFRIVAPRPAEQRQIAIILDTIDDAVRKTEQIIAKLKQVKQGLLHDLLTRGIDDNGELRDPTRHPEQFKNSVFGRLPACWEVRPAHDVCVAVIDCKNRTPPFASEGHPVIRTPNIRDGEFVSDGLVYTDKVSYELWTQRGKPLPGDVLITREAPVGETCLLPDWLPPACLGQRMMMYQPEPKVMDNQFMVAAIMSRPIQKVLVDWAGGSTVGHVRVGDIRRLPIPVPPLREQQHIAATWVQARSKHQTEQVTLNKLRLLKAGLMEDLLTGRVRVTPLLPAP